MSVRRLNQRQRPSGSVLATGAVFLAVICCAGPALLAGGILVVAGGALGSPVVLALAAAVLAGAVVYALRRRSRARNLVQGNTGAAGGSRPIEDERRGAPSTPDLR
ncbi:mercuric ion transport protein [Pseudarthrobacter enclensis]|uniref:Mercuric ion transport protein n=1 Tax=Pseudarthrobacter enclensis TaxID=993070 RepID=A0ABT9RXZ2_9MICC|nr:mercuric ion transport protein [Pseudarthrobacter enclensis]